MAIAVSTRTPVTHPIIVQLVSTHTPLNFPFLHTHVVTMHTPHHIPMYSPCIPHTTYPCTHHAYHTPHTHVLTIPHTTHPCTPPGTELCVDNSVGGTQCVPQPTPATSLIITGLNIKPGFLNDIIQSYLERQVHTLTNHYVFLLFLSAQNYSRFVIHFSFK